MNEEVITIKFVLFRNPYDIPRKSLLDQIARMKTNFLQTSFTNKTKLSDTGIDVIVSFV